MTSNHSFLRRALGAVLLSGAVACAHPAVHHGGHDQVGEMPHRFEHAEEWVPRFEDPQREVWQKPDEVVRALGLAADAKVADIGSGTGYFAVRLARAVPQGRVFGVDIEPDMGRYLGERARREGLSNVAPVVASATETKLPEPVDLALLVDTYHHIGDRVAWLQRLGGKLRPGGRVAIIDFRVDSALGPRGHKLSPEQVRGELEAAGYRPVQTHTFLPEQYFLVFERA